MKIKSYTCDFPIFFRLQKYRFFLYLQIFAQFFSKKFLLVSDFLLLLQAEIIYQVESW